MSHHGVPDFDEIKQRAEFHLTEANRDLTGRWRGMRLTRQQRAILRSAARHTKKALRALDRPTDTTQTDPPEGDG